jgi:hypothetical protein
VSTITPSTGVRKAEQNDQPARLRSNVETTEQVTGTSCEVHRAAFRLFTLYDP